ncbi:hypothetical protein, partial [uncultured Alloprevotella sp.]|uniref:hypothetical protein n=1 Tax=uncultured Alloprevotella sp. TaxID=1283315 RepID=UPI0026219039
MCLTNVKTKQSFQPQFGISKACFFCLKIVSTKAPKEDYFGSSAKWIDISHKLYKKAGIMYL